MHIVVAIAFPLIFRKLSTCIAQEKEISAFAGRLIPVGKNPAANNTTISNSSTSCLQWIFFALSKVEMDLLRNKNTRCKG